jgi:hypothetical protein
MTHSRRAVVGWVAVMTLVTMTASCAHHQTSGVTMAQDAGSGSSVSVTSTTTQGAGGSSVSVSSINVSGADVRVINGSVWIDGEAVPEDATRWTTRDGRTFRIHRDGNQVHIASE